MHVRKLHKAGERTQTHLYIVGEQFQELIGRESERKTDSRSWERILRRVLSYQWFKLALKTALGSP